MDDQGIRNYPRFGMVDFLYHTDQSPRTGYRQPGRYLGRFWIFGWWYRIEYGTRRSQSVAWRRARHVFPRPEHQR